MDSLRGQPNPESRVRAEHIDRSIPPQVSQLFPAKFEFCNGGRPKPEITAQLITLLVDIKT